MMNRSQFLLKLAAQKKFAYVSENISVTSILSNSTSSSSEKSLSPFREDNIHKRESSNSPSRKKIYVHSNVLIPNTSEATSSTDSREFITSDHKPDLQEVVPIQPNIHYSFTENLDFITLQNVNFTGTIATRSFPESTDNVHLQHSLPASNGTDLEQNKILYNGFEYNSTSQSDYILSDHLLSSSSDEEASFSADNKEAVPNLLKVGGNQEDPKYIRSIQTVNYQSTLPVINNKYVRKSAARERPTLCPICFQDVVTHFPRHLFRHHKDHKDVKLILSLKAGNSERLALISALRKQGYFHLTTEKDIVNPVRSSKDPNTQYYVCTFCLCHYSRKLLYKHVKICKNKPTDIKNAGRNCLSKSQTFLISVRSKNQEYLRTSRMKKEVFDIMRADNISEVAKNDTLICLYGESLLAKHKRQQIVNVVSNKVREMARLLIEIRAMDNTITTFFDVLKPEMFRILLSAAKIISGYDEANKSFKAPSLALHMGTNLKLICNVAFKIVIEKINLPKITWDDRDKKKSEIKDLIKLLQGHWCNEISSLALKTLKERKWERTVQLPFSSDILLFQAYVNDLASKAYEGLKNQRKVTKNYKVLTECVLAHVVMFNRKRVGDVQYLKIETYKKENQRIDQDAFTESLTTAEKILSKKFKRVVTDGKGSKPIPILFSPRVQKYISCLLNIRETSTVVPISNPYLFANPNSEDKWMAGTKVIRYLAEKCGAKEPKLLTSTKFRKHIATTLQLMTMEPDEMEQIAKFMGHTKKTHSEFYRLPQDIYQTAKVAKVLLLLEKGKGKEFRGKSLGEIELDKDVYYSSESENESTGNIRYKKAEKIETHISYKEIGDADMEKSRRNHDEKDEAKKLEISENANNEQNEKKIKKLSGCRKPSSKKQGRIRWTIREKEIILKYFATHIKNKTTPKKYECQDFLEKHVKFIETKNWIKIKTFVYNFFRNT